MAGQINVKVIYYELPAWVRKGGINLEDMRYVAIVQ